MDWAALAKLLLGVITQAPALIQEAKDVYTANQANFSATDQAAIDAALAASQTGDAASTAKADAALGDAAKR